MNIIISNSLDSPIYQQIVNQIKKLIIDNKLSQNQLLPSIRTLAKDLNISVITTKRAYEELQKQGLIDIVAGKGTFVSGFKKEIVYEEKVKQIEEIINLSKIIDLSKEDIIEILNCIYEGGIV